MLPKFLYVILKFRGGANGKMDAVRSYHSRKSFKQIRTCLKFHSNDHSNAGNFRLYTVNDGHSNDHSKDLSNDHSPCITGFRGTINEIHDYIVFRFYYCGMVLLIQSFIHLFKIICG